MCGRSNTSSSQISTRRKSSRRLTRARSLCTGSFPLHGGSILFKQTHKDSFRIGTVISTSGVVEKNATGLFDLSYGLSGRKTESPSESSTALATIESSESSSLDLIGDSDSVQKFEEPSYPPAQLIPLKTVIFVRANDLRIAACHRQHQPSNHLHGPAPNSALSDNANDQWVAVNDIHNISPSNHTSMSSPVARNARDELHRRGLELTSNKGLWIPDKHTKSHIKSHCSGFHDLAIPSSPLPPSWAKLTDDVVLLWTANIGSNTCIRAEGMINMDAESLYDLLLDSSRVKEYNEVSLGRQDIWTMERRNGCEGPKEVTKVVRGINKAPMGLKPIVFHSLMCGTELDGGAGYSIVTRTARLLGSSGDVTSSYTTLCTGTLLIMRIKGCDNQCILVNASQFTAPILAMVAKKLASASNKTMYKALQKTQGVH